jgi:prefoldin subunit 5
MRVTELELVDFAGRNTKIGLEKCTLLRGRVGAGKTAHLHALRFGIMGSSILGERAQAALGFGGPGGCAVGVVLDDGFAWTRGLHVKRSGDHIERVSTYLYGPGSRPLAEEVLHERVGAFAPMFDLNVFLGLSSDKRRSFIMRLCQGALGSDPMDDTLMRMRLEWFKLELGAGIVEAIQKARDHSGWPQLFEVLSDEIGLKARNLFAKASMAVQEVMAREGDTSKAITAALDCATGMANQSKSAADSAHATAREHARRKAELVVPAGTLEDLRAKRQQADQQLQQTRQDIGAETERRNTEARLTENLAAVVKQLEGWPKPETVPAESVETLESQTGGIHGAESEARSQVYMVKDKLRRNEENIGWLTVPLEEGQTLPWSLAFRQAEMLDSTLTAALSAEALENWRRLFMHVQTHAQGEVATLEALGRELETLNAQTPELEQAAVAADEVWEAAGRAQLEHDEKLRAARWKALDDKRVDLEVKIRDHKTAGVGQSLEDLNHQVVSLQSQIGQLDQQINTKGRYQLLEEELTKATARAESETLMHDVCKMFANAVRVVRDDYLVRLVDPLVSQMTDILARLDADRVAYCDLLDGRGKSAFDFGWIVGGARKKISFDTMSGGERVIFKAAVQNALIQLANPPLKLLLVDACELDLPNLEGLLAGLIDMNCDNIIVTTWLDIDAPIDPWAVRTITPAQAIAA